MGVTELTVVMFFSILSNFITRTVRHRVKVSAPVHFFGIFSCSRRSQICKSQSHAFGPGYMSFE